MYQGPPILFIFIYWKSMVTRNFTACSGFIKSSINASIRNVPSYQHYNQDVTYVFTPVFFFIQSMVFSIPVIHGIKGGCFHMFRNFILSKPIQN